MAKELVELNGSGETRYLQEGYAITAPGLKGTVQVISAEKRTAYSPLATLRHAFENTGIVELHAIVLSVSEVPAEGGVPGPGEVPHFQLEVVNPDPAMGYLIAAAHENGAITWHIPLDDTGEPVRRATSSEKDKPLRLLIPRKVVEAFWEKPLKLMRSAKKKMLKVLQYPLHDPVLGLINETFATSWDRLAFPYAIGKFGPRDYHAATLPPLRPRDWKNLTSGRSLLFVHGTFSTCQNAFGALGADAMADLANRYQGRLWAFNHPTLATDPADNAWVFGRQVDRVLQSNAILDVDIICHSRGGLVARLLSEPRLARSLRVHKIIHVGVPNEGTPLASPSQIMALLDSLTTAANYWPSRGGQLLLEGVITVLKLLAEGLPSCLPGVTAMDPAGPLIQYLGASPPTGVTMHAITSDFAWPSTHPLHYFHAIIRAAFKQNANDSIVPTSGVYPASGHPDFPLPTQLTYQFARQDSVYHTDYFQHPATATQLTRWL